MQSEHIRRVSGIDFSMRDGVLRLIATLCLSLRAPSQNSHACQEHHQFLDHRVLSFCLALFYLHMRLGGDHITVQGDVKYYFAA